MVWWRRVQPCSLDFRAQGLGFSKVLWLSGLYTKGNSLRLPGT